MDAINDFLKEYLKSPDDLLELVLGWSIFPSVVLTLFLVHGFVKSWLDIASGSRKLVDKVAWIAGRLAKTARGRLFSVFALTSLTLLLEAAWSISVIVMGNVVYYAYFGYYKSPPRGLGKKSNLFSLPPHEVLYRINWLDYGDFSVVYLSILLVLLICTVVRRRGIGSLGVWVATLPLIPVVVIVAFATFIELVLDVFLQGAPMSKYPELGWQGAFLGVAAIFTLASLAAFTAAERLKDQWSALLNKSGGRASG